MDAKNFQVSQFLLDEIRHSLIDFFTDWFLAYPKKILKGLILNFKEFDKSLGLQAMAKNWLNPLYQDYNIWGYIIGVTIRTVYIFIGGASFFAIYVIVGFLILALWYAFPILIFILFFRNLFGI